MTTSQAVALIPARGGSKGIPNKNLAPIAGKPLIQYSIEAARASGVVDRVVVSSDSNDILSAAESLGAQALRRPAHLATDTASSDGVIEHFIETLGLDVIGDRPVVLLQPTSPLRTGAQIAEAMALWRSTPRGMVVSVFEPDHHPAKSFVLDADGLLTGLVDAEAPFTPRQTLPKAFAPNGAIYIFAAAAFLEQGRTPRAGLIPYFMDRYSSIDIDTVDDLAEAEHRLLRRRL